MKAPVIALSERKAPVRRSSGDQRLIRRVTAHVERHIGPVEWVFHDLVSDPVHVDLLWVPPGPRTSFHTIVTCGMSERPMAASHPRDDGRYSELLLRLPATWPLDPNGLDTEAGSWPLRELSQLACTPHMFRSRLGPGHIVVYADPPQPICPATRFCGTVLALPDWTPSEFRKVRVDPRRKVRFFSVIPLYAEELLLSREHGPEPLSAHLRQAGVSDLIDPERPNLLASPN